MQRRCDAIVVGAGPAGLAVAACLKTRGLDPVIFEKADAVGSVWRRHYDRLHLHTDRARSGLPGLPMPAAYGRYPSRAQVVSYLESYARTFGLAPVFNTPVRSLAREGPLWRAETDGEAWEAPIAVIATGLADFPHVPNWPGMEGFPGQVLHSSLYRNPAPFAGQRVLVIGYGNSGSEIALDLAEAGIRTAMAVRGPINVIPREMLGRPILAWSLASRVLPPRLADAVNAPLLRLAVGSIEKLGLRRAPKGPLQSIAEDGRVPLIDVGTLDAIREGRIELRGDVAGFTREGVDLQGLAARSLRRGDPRDRLPARPPRPSPHRQERPQRDRSAPRQRKADRRAGPLLLRRDPFRARTVEADRDRRDQHRGGGGAPKCPRRLSAREPAFSQTRRMSSTQAGTISLAGP